MSVTQKIIIHTIFSLLVLYQSLLSPASLVERSFSVVPIVYSVFKKKMRVFSLLVTGLSVSLTWAKTPMSVQVMLRGKTYDVEDVTTVSELQERVGEISGVDPSKQGRVLFDGKRLNSDQTLEAAGVASGDQLNIVPGKSSSKKKKSSSSAGVAAAAAAATAAPTSNSAMADILKGAGLDPSALDDMVKNMGGGDGEAPSLQESMEMMSGMMNSPIFQEYMNDPDRLEESRQMILNNPMLKSMMGGMPGMEELLNDPSAWRDAMQGAAQMYANMDQDDMMKAMMGGAAGAGGMPPGLFDGMENAQASSALDELSEDED